MPSRGDLAAAYEVAGKMSSLPLSKEGVLPLAIAVLVPMIGVGATRLLVEDLVRFARHLLP